MPRQASTVLQNLLNPLQRIKAKLKPHDFVDPEELSCACSITGSSDTARDACDLSPHLPLKLRGGCLLHVKMCILPMDIKIPILGDLHCL